MDFKTVLFLPNGMPVFEMGTLEKYGRPQPDKRRLCIRCWQPFKTAPGEKRYVCLKCEAWIKERIAELEKNPNAPAGNMPEGFTRAMRAIKPAERRDHVAYRNIGQLED